MEFLDFFRKKVDPAKGADLPDISQRMYNMKIKRPQRYTVPLLQ